MSEVGQRMTDGNKEPDAKSLSAWMASVNCRRWTHLCQYIETAYPGVFVPKWLFGGKKHGWGLRFKKSKSFCTLIPEQNRLVVLIVFGEAEREKAETILGDLSRTVREAYKKATTYHDGKWLALSVERDGILSDIERLFAIKRRPKTMRIRKGDRVGQPRSR
jgi:hypothetical protein